MHMHPRFPRASESPLRHPSHSCLVSVVSSRRSSCARLPQLSEARALPRAQLRRRPALDHLALVDDDNIVGAHDGLEAMGDREDGGAVDGREGALDERVRLEVDL